MSAPKLTRGQAEMLPLLAEGLSIEEMAARVFLSTDAIKSRLHFLYRRLGVHNAHGAVGAGFRLGLIALPCGPIRREDEPYDPPADPDDPARFALGAGLNRKAYPYRTATTKES